MCEDTEFGGFYFYIDGKLALYYRLPIVFTGTYTEFRAFLWEKFGDILAPFDTFEFHKGEMFGLILAKDLDNYKFDNQ